MFVDPLHFDGKRLRDEGEPVIHVLWNDGSGIAKLADSRIGDGDMQIGIALNIGHDICERLAEKLEMAIAPGGCYAWIDRLNSVCGSIVCDAFSGVNEERTSRVCAGSLAS